MEIGSNAETQHSKKVAAGSMEDVPIMESSGSGITQEKQNSLVSENTRNKQPGSSKSYKQCILEAVSILGKKQGCAGVSIRTWIKNEYPSKAESKIFVGSVRKALNALVKDNVLTKVASDRYKTNPKTNSSSKRDSSKLGKSTSQPTRKKPASTLKPKFRIRPSKPALLSTSLQVNKQS